jgi:hypothetical protein
MASLLFIQVLHMGSSLLRGWIMMTLLQLPVDHGVHGSWLSSPIRVLGGGSSISTVSGLQRTLRNRCCDASTTALFMNQQNVGECWERRDFLQTTMAASAAVFIPATTTSAAAAVAATQPPPLLLDAGQGGGIDISIDTKSKILLDPANIVFPASLQGRWSCERTCLSVEGDGWKAMMMMGNSNSINAQQFFGPKATPERYEIQFIPAPFQPEKYTVLDRSYELRSRIINNKDSSAVPSAKVQWNAQEPNIARIGATTEMAVIQRSVIVPDLEQDIFVAGGQELIRISSTSGDTDAIVRAVLLVQQRFHPAAAAVKERSQQNNSSSSISRLEGLELVQTFRVLDGVADTEFPTSTAKYRLKLVKLGPLVNNTTTVVEDDNSTTKPVSSSSLSMYFDGSTWYENGS